MAAARTPAYAHKERVAVVAARDVVRAGLVALVQEAGYEVVLSAAGGAAFMTACLQGLVLDLVLVELDMPKPDGFVVLGWVKDHRPQVRPLAVCQAGHAGGVQRAMRQQACTVLCGDLKAAELCKALYDVAATGHHLSDLLKRLCTGVGAATALPSITVPPDLTKLSDMELEYLRHHCAKDNPDLRTIAKRMEVGYETARTYRRRVYRKLGVHDALALFRVGLRAGLVQD